MKKVFIGIDFSKEKFDATAFEANGVERVGEIYHAQFKMTIKCFKDFIEWVKNSFPDVDRNQWLFCGENTGGYSKPLCKHLYTFGYDMWLANPYAVNKSNPMKRLKSDKADSLCIAEYAMRNCDKAVIYEPLDPILEELREAFLYRHMLVRKKAEFQVRRGEKDRTQGKLHADKAISKSELRMQKQFEKEIEKIDKLIDETIKSDEHLSHLYDIITSVPGVGVQNACCLLIYTNAFKRFNLKSRKIASYWGVAPFGADSGTSVHVDPHVSFMANRMIKALLTQAAITAVRFNEKLKAYYIRMTQERGKKMQVVLNNVKNKLLALITALIRDDCKYDPCFVYKNTDKTKNVKLMLN